MRENNINHTLYYFHNITRIIVKHQGFVKKKKNPQKTECINCGTTLRGFSVSLKWFNLHPLSQTGLCNV